MPAKKTKKARANPAPLRVDLSVYNEATGFVVTHGSMAGAGATPGDARWKRAVAAGDLLPVELVQDDAFILRLVVGGELSPEESAEWVGRLEWKLRVPDGALAVAGGVELVMEPVEGGAGRDYLRSLDALREVAVPPGDYRAELLAYVHGVNGHWHLARVDEGAPAKEPVGAWWRRTRGRAKPPAWLRRACRADPSRDPGHEEEWARPPKKTAREPAADAPEVDFLLHLTPLSDGAKTGGAPRLAEGFFGVAAFEARRPALCPEGLVARDVVKNPPPPPAPPRPLETVDVLALVKDRALSPIAGGPVAHPVAKLIQVYRLAWLATDGASPEIRIESPRGVAAAGAFAKGWTGVERVAVTTEGETVRIGFAPGGGARWAELNAMKDVAPWLGAIPDGSTVELLTAHAPDPRQHRDLGVQRWRGVVKGGEWSLAESYPALDAALVREALALSAAVDEGERVRLRDAREGERALERSKADRVLFRKNAIVVLDGQIGLAEKDEGLMHWVAGYVLRERWGSVWPSWVEPEEDRKAREALAARFASIAESNAKKLAAAPPPPQRELVLAGKVGGFSRADLLAERPQEKDAIAQVDRQLSELGFVLLGDLVCTRFPNVFVRGYGQEHGDTWAELLVTPMKNAFDFFTHWETAGFTTTLGEGPGDDAKKGVFVSRHPDLNFYLLKDLHGHHEKRKKVLGKKLGQALPAGGTLVGYAEALDRGLARQLGL